MEPGIAPMLAQSERRLDLCISFALLWLATADGAFRLESQRALSRHLARLQGASDKLDDLLRLIASGEQESFLEVCDYLRRQLPVADRPAFLAAAVEVAAALPLSISANHLLRFYSDLFRLSPELLQQFWREHSGEALPEPGDPGSLQWWEHRGRREQLFESRGPLTRAQALAVLGLDREAPPAEIKRAYRRLVQSYHPDRCGDLSQAARENAQLRFLRVHEAYEVLNG